MCPCRCERMCLAAITNRDKVVGDISVCCPESICHTGEETMLFTFGAMSVAKTV